MSGRCAHTGKVVYGKKAAQTYINAHPDRKLRKYPCETCNGWHLTHQPYQQQGTNKGLQLIHGEDFEKLINDNNSDLAG